MNKRNYYLCLIIAIILGCAPTKYSHINVLDHKKEATRGIYVDKVWFNQEEVKNIKNIKLEDVNVDSIKDEKGITKAECKDLLQNVIFNNVNNGGLINNLEDSLMVVIKLVITNMSPGDRASRIMAAELGFGHANVEIQAIVFNKNKERIIEISDSRNSTGAIGFRDNAGDAGPQLVRELIEQIAGNIMMELNKVIKIKK
jgi:hypothetical protein